MIFQKNNSAKHWPVSKPIFERPDHMSGLISGLISGHGPVGLASKPQAPCSQACGVFYSANGIEHDIGQDDSARLRLLFVSSMAITLVLASIILRGHFNLQMFNFQMGAEGRLLNFASAMDSFEQQGFGQQGLDKARGSFFHKLEKSKEGALSTQTAFISQIVGEHAVSQNQADKLAAIIVTESLGAGVDPLFTAALIKHESTFKNAAVSHMGAKGLMQILPNTAHHIAQKTGQSISSASSLLDPRTNIRLGLSYIKYLESMFGGNRRLALMAYNWGPGNVLTRLKQGSRVTPSVQAYADKVLRTHNDWMSSFKAHKAQLALATRSTDTPKIS